MSDMKTHFGPQEKLLKHWDRLTEWKDTGKGRPILVEISPSNNCPAKCPWCWFVTAKYKQKHSLENISWDLMEPLLHDLKDLGVMAINWTGGGDPEMYPDLDKATKLAQDIGIQQGIFTNGYKTLSFPERFNWIRLTVTEKFKVPEKTARAYSEKTWTGVNFNLTNGNFEHVEKMCKEAKEYGVNYFQVRPALADRIDLQEEVPNVDFLRKYETEDFKVFLTPYKFESYKQPHKYKTCYGHNFSPFVWHNGDVTVCAYHFGKDPYKLGNLGEMSFKEIWDSSRGDGMLKCGVPVIRECQHNCKNNEINTLMANIKDREFVDQEVHFL